MSHTQAMAIGTAGFTAALAVARLERHGVQPGDGPVLVTGATGGVGSTAVSILAARGYEVVASTGKDAREYLESLGAAEIVGREDVAGDGKPLGKQRWAAAVDSVGGAVLAGLFPQIRYGGAVAATGLTAGIGVETTVMPFILRSVALLGIDSVQTPMDERAEIWKRLAGDLRPPQLDDAIAREITLDELEPALDTILEGGMTGRTVVRVAYAAGRPPAAGGSAGRGPRAARRGRTRSGRGRSRRRAGTGSRSRPPARCPGRSGR